MRKNVIAGLMSLALLFLEIRADAQVAITPKTLEITFQKTSSIVFPFAIRAVDRGSRDVLVQKAAGVENVLQLKAAKKDFPETSLTVITADGHLYCFDVQYSPAPQVLNLSFSEASAKVASFNEEETDQAQVHFDCQLIAAETKRNVSKSDRRFGVKLQLSGLYIRNNVIYCQLKLENDTHVDYDIGQLRFFVRDQKKARRTATQEVEIKPIYTEGNTEQILGKTQHIIVFALPKFTIPDKKYLAIQLMEKNGGRHLALKLRNNTIIKSEPIDM